MRCNAPAGFSVQAMREMRARHNRLHQEELEQVSKAKERQAAQEKRRIEAECRGVVEGLW